MNLDEIIESNVTNIFSSSDKVLIKNLMREAVKQALELAARRACLKINNGRPIQIDRESILNVINEIE